MDQMTRIDPEILENFSLQDRVAIVTGGGKGIGKGIAMAFAKDGANVVIAEIDSDACNAAVDEIRALGGTAIPVISDVLESRQVDELVATTLKTFGKIDILVNNVGATRSSPRKPLLGIEEDLWDFIVALNLKTSFLCCKAVAKVMVEQKSGNIINITSGAGMRPYPGQLPYGAAKSGVINFTQSLALQLSPYNIRVNAIAPGTVATPGMAYLGDTDERTKKRGVPLGRAGRPEDIGMGAIYLASDASAYVTGFVLPISGGPALGGKMLEEAQDAWETTKSL
ncbi:SDR family NAD(P)-dependent oxidoreductase [Thermodesulfobacteriota bacterium]